jgi:hypothetical protein
LGRDFTFTAVHKCLEPYEGIPMNVRELLPISHESAKKFENVALLVAKSIYFDEIEKKLKKRGIDCWINRNFLKYNLGTFNSSAPIHFNINFSQLLADISGSK